MSESAQRAAVVAEARSWCGTPYHPMADVKGAGCDCAMLLVRVFCDLGLVAPFDPRPYPPDWHFHRDDERYLGFIMARSAQVEIPLPGDVMVMRYARAYSHGGIVVETEPLTIVHAYIGARRVMEEIVGPNLELRSGARKRQFYSYWSRQTAVGP
jgi:NlpC/P60 family putative phage cell wall peptidase